MKDIETLEVLTDTTPLINENNETDGESDSELELKITKKKIYNVKPKDPNAPKKERTPAQIQAWNKALETRQMNREGRKVVKETENERISREINEKKEQAKKSVEEKIVKKAVSIKKKQIKKEVILDEISDDDTPTETIKQIIRKQPSRSVKETVPVYQQPTYNFV